MRPHLSREGLREAVLWNQEACRSEPRQSSLHLVLVRCWSSHTAAGPTSGWSVQLSPGQEVERKTYTAATVAGFAPKHRGNTAHDSSSQSAALVMLLLALVRSVVVLWLRRLVRVRIRRQEAGSELSHQFACARVLASSSTAAVATTSKELTSQSSERVRVVSAAAATTVARVLLTAEEHVHRHGLFIQCVSFHRAQRTSTRPDKRRCRAASTLTPRPLSPVCPSPPLDPSGSIGSMVPSACLIVCDPSGWVMSSGCGVP